MDTSFLPKGYKAPTGNYFTIEKGENRVRIMSSAIVGHEYWTVDKKPVRSRTPFKTVPADARIEEDGRFKPKHFWAFLVWNFAEEKLQVMEITQVTIMSAIQALVANPKWGAPSGYDLVINATGDGFSREYAVVPEPHTEAPKADTSGIVLDELFSGGDPFAPKGTEGSVASHEIVAEDFPQQGGESVIS